MPERPKRRKNNKNKRKNNKNNRSDVNKNNTEENETTVVESSSDVTTEVTNENKNEIVKEDCDEPMNLTCENLPVHIKSKISTLDEAQQCDTTQRKQNSDDDSLVLPSYIVETPDQTIKIKPKLDNGMKSKSCDNDDSPTIVEITEDVNNQSDKKINASAIDSSQAIVTHDESNIEWENVDDFKLPQTELIEGVLSSTTIPLNVAECEHTKALSPEEESSLRNYLQTLNLSTNSTNFNAGDIKTEIEQLINREVKYRLRRKGFTEDIIYPRAGTSRSLGVIDEEGSSGSSKTSQRHSYLSDKKSDTEELEDEVFECKKEQNLRNKNIDFMTQTSRHLIPQKCIRVDAKLKEPEISEARGDWTVKTVEKLSGAELVYLTDSSSSTSSIYDANDDFSKGEEADTSVRIITPTIEVTDAETMLSNTFLVKNYNINAKEPRENDINDDKINLQLLNNKDSDDIKTCDFSYNDPHSNGNEHEIIVLSTDNLKTNLFVKDLEDENILSEKCDLEQKNEQIKINKKSPNDIDEYDLEIKVLKCELNDAINNLIKEVTSDSENSNECSKDTFKRQDSSSSIDSSQCTAKYNPTHSSLNDVSNLIHDEEYENINKENMEKSSSASHVKDVLHCVTTKLPLIDKNINNKNICPTTLRDICLKKISSFPFGEKILEELAYVSQRLQNTVLASQSQEIIPSTTQSRKENIQLPPPPIKPRKSSLKITKEEQNKPPVPARNELIYECLSPSQKMLMEKTNTIIEKDEIPQKVEPYISRADEKDKNNQKELISGNSIEKIPMKSQTGSRLLALLRDTSNSPKLNSSTTSNVNSKSSQVKHNSESYSKRLLEEINTTEIPTRNKHYPPVLYDNSPRYVSPRRSNMSSYCYESDSGIRDKSFHTMQNSKKYFHYSTGNLSKEIESDITSIQNMHRYCTNLRDQKIKNEDIRPRRPSLPKDLCDQQMEYIRQKEKEVDAEIRRLEQENYKKNNRGPRAPMFSDKESGYDQTFDSKNNNYSKKYFSVHQTPTRPERSKISSLFSSSEEELLREKMYSEYVNQMAEREQRKQQKVIKITQTPIHSNATSKSMPALESFNSMNNRIEQEFISKAKERWCKLGIEDPETEDEREKGNNVYREPRVIEHKIKVIESGEEKDVQKLPSHMQEFVRFTVNDKGDENGCTAIWRPGAPAGGVTPSAESPSAPPPPPPPIWSPSSNTTSPQTPRKTFRPVHFEDTPPPRRKFGSSDQNGCTSGSESEGRLRTSLSAPVTGLNTLGSSSTSRLPRAQNPTVTLLQKAREGQISRGLSNYPQERDPRLPRDRPSPPKGDPVHALRKEYASEGEGDRSDYERSQKMNDVKKKIEGIGPTTKDGMPVALRSEVKDPSRWYKKMYDTIHKNKYDEDYVTIRYKNRRGELQRPNSNRSQYAYFDPRSGYLSEPEGGLSRLASSTWSDAYDSDVTTGPRRRTASVQEDRRYDDTSSYEANNKYSTLASGRARQEVYKSQPGRIENYVPGKSSVIDKEAKQWWDEVMDIFDGWLDENSPLPPYSTLLARAIQKSQNESSALSQSQASPKEKKDLTSAILSKSNMARALKESGYESDSTLIFRRREDTEAPLSPAERRAAYKDLQAGGEPPLRGFRSPAPPRQDESEIEYIPISSTLTKIRVHKKSPQVHEMICYPVTGFDNIYGKKLQYSELKSVTEPPPKPPQRRSSKNSKTLKLVTSTKPTRDNFTQSNVDFLKDKISNKLKREDTHIIIKKNPESYPNRILSTSAPPAINKMKSSISSTKVKQKMNLSYPKPSTTSSFSSPRRTMLPINYSGCKFGDSSQSVTIEGGVGRRTPITNILDKVTSLDKLWSSQKRNECIDTSKIKPKSVLKNATGSKETSPKVVKQVTTSVTHKSRDMIRTSEKVKKNKISNIQSKSSQCLTNEPKSITINPLQRMTNMSKSSTHIMTPSKKNPIKTALVTNLKKKKSLENVLSRPRSVPCVGENSKISKSLNKNNITKSPNSKKNTNILPEKTEDSSQFGDVLDDVSNFGSIDNFELNDTNIKQARNAVVSDSFFQNLFFKKPFVLASDNVSQHTTINSVMEKAKVFQSLPETYLSPSNSINTYLIHRKPVSLSRFKIWDRRLSPTHIQSTRSISWPGKMDGKIRKFESLTKRESDFGSSSSLSTNRSKSEPPINKIYFSQTSRPISPTIVFHRKHSPSTRKSVSPTKMFFLHSGTKSPKIDKPVRSSKSMSPSRVIFSESPTETTSTRLRGNYQIIKTNSLENIEDKNQGTIYFSQTSRLVSPKVKKTVSRSQSPASIRSPSSRRIHNARTHTKLETEKKEYRRRSADNEERNVNKNKKILRTKSDSNISANDPDYDEYIQDIQNIKGRSERFRELNRYYAYLERVGELEKATSSRNLLYYRKKDEEIIDFDRWKKIRIIERAEEELNNLYSKLKRAQNEDDILFYPRDVNDYRWNFNRERGLRVKEKSVEDLKEELQQKKCTEGIEIDHSQCKDAYKPLWRGTSVAETAFNINNKNKDITKSYKVQPNKINLQFDSMTDLRKKIGLGNRLWSSLSMDQVNALKNQLNAIYGKEFNSKSNKDDEKYTIEVKEKSTKNPSLHVRCSSLITPKTSALKTTINKSESIAAITYPINFEKELKNNVNKMQMTLSENEKKRISQSLSKEVLDRISKFDTFSLKEDNNFKHQTEYTKTFEDTNVINKPKNIVVTDKINQADEPIKKLSQKNEISNTSSASETETGSDMSSKTVIYKGPKIEVQKKVEYFESVKDDKQPQVIYHARDSSDEKNISKEYNKVEENRETKFENNQIFQSQSCADIKELFGESEKNKFLSLPLKADLNSRSTSPQSELYVSDRRTPDTRFSSDETIWRSRSPSPDPERYWRAYLKLAREGEVRRLARQFDSPSAAGAVLRRFRSDPEIIRNDIKNWPSERASRQEKCRVLLPVARMPLRPNNRFMPHIDIISKLAALRRRNSTRSHSAEEALECRPGEVERIRRRFEAMSLLGQIYTSTPDVSELQNIASYLAGPWIAHQYPKPEDNNKPLKDPNTLVRGRTAPTKSEKNQSFKKNTVKLNSILKNESLAKQAFDPSAHRPASRYEPPRTPPRPPPAAWPYRLAPFVTPSRHTVTFQETDSAPEPPRRASHGSYSDSESPSRRYVESDVNIHYRCPVRHDPLPLVPERELARQQAEHMKRLYREQKRNKYLQENDIRAADIEAFDASIKELQDMQNRRHQDNFMPSQKTVVPLNRYDEAEKIIAKALYTFNGQTARELSFRKGDIINVRKQIDSNWYEGEVHGKIGLFPYNYVELLKGDGVQTLKKSAVIEGRARAKFDFIAQTNLELPLKKGEVVVLTRRIDHNWWEGRNGNKTGIFPDSYVTILQEPSQSKPEPHPILNTGKPVASPAAHGLLNGADKRSMGAHRYTPQPNSPALANAPPATQPLAGYVTKSSHSLSASDRGYGPPTGAGVDLNNTEPLYVDTNAEAVPYRAMYKYRPQNPDELELNEGDTVYVLEKCDDGWYVGSSQRTGRFGTFPGNYVESI
ncbi:uncharacterized protein LOC113401289 isoform X4 [Vanessa tameamea]|uniref:Uncharacterized protein LOC113401289 isoform X4 n=1 Tax=Vanessa tameamea TaxID=334116 RepID=A0ABM4AJC6_VANTA